MEPGSYGVLRIQVDGFHMASPTLSVLIIAHLWPVRVGLRASLLADKKRQFLVHEATSLRAGAGLMGQVALDMVLIDLDLDLDDVGGMPVSQTIGAVKQLLPNGVVIVMSERPDPELVFACVRAGVSAFINKGEGDEHALECALDVVVQGGVYLPKVAVGRRCIQEPSSLEARFRAVFATLTRRQRQVLQHVCQGLTNKAIANLLNLSEDTIRKTYVTQLLRTFKVSRRTELLSMMLAMDREAKDSQPLRAGASERG
jgi:two-component system, NarL family, nitrate/nitrite response regulator NarL